MMIELMLAAAISTGDIAPLNRTSACERGLLHTSAKPATLMRPQDWPQAQVRRLGDLPKAKAEFAVVRRVDGCMVAAPAGYRMPPQ